jgi:hypothetical protein
MSTETLKFFEDKSTEAIINWMLSHLSEEQIRMCLDQSGIPDLSQKSSDAGPSGVTPPEAIAAASASSGPMSTITLPDGSRKQLEPKPNTGGGASKIFLDKYRKICNGTSYVIQNVDKSGVVYYQFKEVETEDLPMNPLLTVGEIDWVLRTTPLSEFKTYCTDEDREVLQLLVEESPNKFTSPPLVVRELVNDYIANGFPSPVPGMVTTVAEVEPVLTIPSVQDLVDMSETVMKALKIQQESTDFIRQNYPLLHENGITMYPVFIYGSEGNNLLFMAATVQDGKLTLVQDSVNKALINSKFKKIMKSLGDSMSAGMYIPSPGIPQQLNEVLPDSEIKRKIAYVYTTAKTSGINFFGSLEDDLVDLNMDMSMPLLGRDSSFVIVPENPTSGFEMEDLRETLPKVSRKKKKKASEMTQGELDERMLELFGSQFASEHDAVKYTNSLGVVNVKYVKKCSCPTPERDSSFEEIESPIFTEFQGKPSVNSGPGRFGEEVFDEDLLFS